MDPPGFERLRAWLVLASATLFVVALLFHGYHAVAFTEQLMRLAAGALR